MKPEEKRSILAGLYGNTLEWYDFLLYASFAPLFAKLFFPSSVEFLSLTATFSVFAIGFFMRPLGGLLLGYYADHVGRKKALIVSIVIMTLSTFLVALIPGYQVIGIISPILFILLRLIQGLAVGGELPGSTTFLIEHMISKGRGFAGSLVLATAFFGIFLGSFTASTLSNLLDEQNLVTWGWRLAYGIGGLLGVIGIYLRTTSIEPAVFLKQEKTQTSPTKLTFAQYWRELIIAILFTSILAMGNYLLIAYVTTLLVKSEGFLLKDALEINFMALLLLTILIPLMGLLSDRIGRKPIFLFGLISLIVLIVPIYWLLLSHNWVFILISELLLAVILAPINATVPTIIAELFPTAVRASGISIGYNIGQALFGGTIPLVALTLVEWTSNKYMPAWYLLFWSIFILFYSRYSPETYRKTL